MCAYRVTTDGYSPFFREQEDCPETVYEDTDDGYTCALCNTSYEKDLQLAAELGKTLLERNKELEAALRQHQNVVDDQAQEIEYLRKQTAALREVNDSRLRIYEQLEVSIGELEAGNHRLSAQATADKRHIASLEGLVEKLEGRLEEVEGRLQEREEERGRRGAGAGGGPGAAAAAGPEVVAALRDEAADLRAANARLSSKLKQLQATIDTVTQENLRLEERLVTFQHKEEEMPPVEHCRRGSEIVCGRCLRSQEEISLTGDEDEGSVIDSLINDDHIKESLSLCGADNPYRTLVEKYEALLRVQRCPGLYRPHNAEGGKALSLQEELDMSGEFFHREEDDCSEAAAGAAGAGAGAGGGGGEAAARPGSKATPTDFSETSSGFSDETINKGTQTEAHVPPGAFLCSITDGDDCKFSIYDEANAVDSRFRKTPEYRRLFREIFDVLKRAAEAKDEGESLPLLEDMTPVGEAAPKAPPVTPTAHDAAPAPAPALPEPSAVAGAAAAGGGDDPLERLARGLGTSARRSRNRKQRAAEFPAANGTVVVKTGRRKKDGGWRARHGGGGGSDSGRSTPERRGTPPAPAPAAHPAPGGNPWFAAPPPPSTASQEVAKLKQLEKSYAEVLRLGREHVNRK